MVFTVRRFAFLAGLVGSGALFAAAGAACGKDGSGGFAADTGSGGGGGDSSSTTSSAGGSTSSSSSSGVGGGAPCEGVEATISDVTTGVVGPGVKVQVTGAVAMSQKFLVSKGSSSGSCLWGVFVSAPNLTETAPNSGMLVLDYGFNAEIDDGGTDAYCPRLGIDPTGDDIPRRREARRCARHRR
jgi:hypothetical protein